MYYAYSDTYSIIIATFHLDTIICKALYWAQRKCKDQIGTQFSKNIQAFLWPKTLYEFW